jgi:hypothetical protein
MDAVGYALAQAAQTANTPTIPTWTTGLTAQPIAKSQSTAGGTSLGLNTFSGLTNSSTITTASYLYDPAGNAWTSKAADPVSRQAAACSVPVSSPIVTGGTNIGGTQQGATYSYDPVGDAWTSKASVTSWNELASAASTGGKMYFINGYSGGATAVNYAFDPVGNTWTGKTFDSWNRYAGSAAYLASTGLIYAVDGNSNNGSGGVAINSAFDPVGNTWTNKTSDSNARYALKCVALGSFIYTIDGYTASTESAINNKYDPVGNAWTGALGDSTARAYPMGDLVNGLAYLVGGNTAGGIYYAVNNRFGIPPPVGFGPLLGWLATRSGN